MLATKKSYFRPNYREHGFFLPVCREISGKDLDNTTGVPWINYCGWSNRLLLWSTPKPGARGQGPGNVVKKKGEGGAFGTEEKYTCCGLLCSALVTPHKSREESHSLSCQEGTPRLLFLLISFIAVYLGSSFMNILGIHFFSNEQKVRRSILKVLVGGQSVFVATPAVGIQWCQGPLLPLFVRLILEEHHHQEIRLPSFCLSLRNVLFPFSSFFFFFVSLLGSTFREVGWKGKHELNVRQGTWEWGWDPAPLQRLPTPLWSLLCTLLGTTVKYCSSEQRRKALSSRKLIQQCLSVCPSGTPSLNISRWVFQTLQGCKQLSKLMQLSLL